MYFWPLPHEQSLLREGFLSCCCCCRVVGGRGTRGEDGTRVLRCGAPQPVTKWGTGDDQVQECARVCKGVLECARVCKEACFI